MNSMAYKLCHPLHPKQIRWEIPPKGWLKLNTNGSSLGNPRIVGGGGIVCNNDGAWVLGFSRHIGITSNFMVELWALRDGLILYIERNFHAAEIDMNAKALFNVLTDHA